MIRKGGGGVRIYALDGKRLVPDFELPISAEALGVTTEGLLDKK